MRKVFKLILLLFISSTCFSQSAIKGKVSDTLEKKNLSNAVVSLINKKDSVLFKFTRSNEKGEFVITKVTPGQYILMVTYPKFASYTDQVEVKDNTTHDIGTVPLTQLAKLLEGVIVRSGSSIRIKGDTTEFVADSFKVKEGATVEDLLKELPGFQVDSRGNITTQGKRVDKVLVDGEEFFGNDPTMATQNIGAKAVDKVQVYDTKTEQQALKGISSGNEGKTLNITLKADAKKGGFGKFYGATDFNKYHDVKGLYNRFVGKKKVSVYGTKSTISTGTLSYQDQQSLGTEPDEVYDEISGSYYLILGGSDGEFSDYNLRGLPNSYTAGGLFNNKWSADKQSINSSFRYNRLAVENVSSTLTQNILPSGSIFTDRKTTSSALNQQHALNVKYEWKIDSLASIKFTGAGIYKTSESFTKVGTLSSNDKGEIRNTNNQNRENETEKKQMDNTLLYRQQFKKKNRLLLLTLRFSGVNDDNTGMLKTITEYSNSPLPNDTIDQLKRFVGTSRTFGTKATYNEPLSAKWNMVLDYSYNRNNSISNRNSFNRSNSGKYEELDPDFSNNFDLVAASHTGTTTFRYVDKKLRFAFGSGLSGVQYKLNNLDNNDRNTYNFLNITPQLSLGYTIKPQNTLSFNYSGSTIQPRLDQLQPIQDNTDNLNIYQGNPDLKVGFRHSISASYYNYKVLKTRYLYFGISYSTVQNSISNFNMVDTSTYKRIYMPVNANGVRNWSISTSWSHGEGNKKWRKSAQIYANGGRSINFTNTNGTDFKDAQKIVTDYSTVTLYTGIGYQVVNKYSFNVGPTVSYNTSGSSVQTANNLKYFSYGGRVNGYFTLGKFEISSDANVDYRQRLPIFSQNTNIIQWNGNISRKIFKDNSGKIFLIANDILNQNKGYSRVINSNIITDDRYLRISRYFLLKFEWTLTKAPAK
jgi:hypothetical protein